MMKKGQLAGVAVGLFAAVAAGVMASSMKSPPPEPPPAPIVMAPVVETEEVLVATRHLDYGSGLDSSAMKWMAWPIANIPLNAIRQKDVPDAITKYTGAIVRGEFEANQPLYGTRLVTGALQGIMATLVAPGHRAVAINIDMNGSTTAGNFILPNDRVDVIHVGRDPIASKATETEVLNSETILRNVRVLAIGQNVQTENGKSVVSGANATLELDPQQTELIILAQRSGMLTLALRSMADSLQNPNQEAETAINNNNEDSSLTIVRYGLQMRAK